MGAFRNKKGSRTKEKDFVAGALIYTGAILKDRCEIGVRNARGTSLPGKRGFFIFVQFSAQDNALVTGPPSVDKMPKSPLDWSSRVLEQSTSLLYNVKREIRQVRGRPRESLPFPPPMNRSPATTTDHSALPPSPFDLIWPYYKHFVLPIHVYNGTLSLMTVKSPLLRTTRSFALKNLIR